MCRVARIRGLALRAAEGAYLLRSIAEHNLGRAAARLDDAARARLPGLRLRDWVTSSAGEAAAAQLISVLVTQHLAAAGAPGLQELAS